MNQRRAGSDRLDGIEDRGQFLVVHLNQPDGFFRRVLIGRGRNGNGFADEPHLVLGQDGIVQDGGAEAEQMAVFIFRTALGGQDRFDALDLHRLRHVHAQDPGVRKPAAEELSVQHVRERHIRDIDAGPRRLFRTVLPGEIFSDPLVFCHRSRAGASCFKTIPFRSRI